MAASSRARVRIGIVGLGHVGLATGLAFAYHGQAVQGYDIKVETRSSVSRGIVPYKEPNLMALLKTQISAGRFQLVDSVAELVRNCEGVFICVPTPGLPTGRIDLRPIEKCAKSVGISLRSTRDFRTVVVKSTVVPGTTEHFVAPILFRESRRRARDVGVASNPEFLAEGTMVRDSIRPSRIVIGTSDSRSLAWLRRVYRGFDAPIFNLSPSGAELVKYAANTFLALKVSFANELARLSDRFGVNVDSVMTAVGHDRRIGTGFLRAGPGFGGSCFDKDVRAFVRQSEGLGVRFRCGETALLVNDEQLDYVIERIKSAVGSFSGKRLTLLGLSFKAGTDDVRESRALTLAHRLVHAGAFVRGHDPVAVDNFRRTWIDRFGPIDGQIDLAASIEVALEGADAAILHADWPVYKRWKSAWSKRMRNPLLIDLRRSVDPLVAKRAGLRTIGLGAGSLADHRDREGRLPAP